MEKNEGQRLVQKIEIQLEEPIGWSVQSYKYEDISDEDNTKEPMARLILKNKKNWL